MASRGALSFAMVLPSICIIGFTKRPSTPVDPYHPLLKHLNAYGGDGGGGGHRAPVLFVSLRLTHYALYLYYHIPTEMSTFIFKEAYRPHHGVAYEQRDGHEGHRAEPDLHEEEGREDHQHAGAYEEALYEFHCETPTS